MANLPQRPIATGAVSKVSDGSLTQTARLETGAVGQTQMIMTVSSAAGATVNNINIFPGCWRAAVAGDGKPPANINIAVDGFASVDAFLAYIMHNKFGIAGFEAITNDTDNYEGNAGITEYIKEANGQESQKVQHYFRNKMKSTGAGYDRKIRFSAGDYTQLINTGILNVSLNSLKAGTSITFYFNLIAQDKAAEVSSLSAQKF